MSVPERRDHLTQIALRCPIERNCDAERDRIGKFTRPLSFLLLFSRPMSGKPRAIRHLLRLQPVREAYKKFLYTKMLQIAQSFLYIVGIQFFRKLLALFAIIFQQTVCHILHIIHRQAVVHRQAHQHSLSFVVYTSSPWNVPYCFPAGALCSGI